MPSESPPAALPSTSTSSPHASTPNLESSRTRLDLSYLSESPGRLVIPLGPPTPLTDTNPAATPESTPAMLLDYLTRLSKYEPRLRRYAASKLLASGTEPVAAFSGSLGPSVAGTPLTSSPRQEADPVRGFSLLDLERSLLSASRWWQGKSGDSSGSSSPRPPVRHTDSGRLDVDLSSVFRPPSRRPSASSSDILPRDAGTDLFLHYYSSDSLIQILENTGILSSLANLGFTSPSLIFDTSDSFQHRLSLVDASLFELNLSSNDRFLIDLYMKRRDRWDEESLVCYQLNRRVVNAGSWERLRELSAGDLRSPYVGMEGAREAADFLVKGVEKWSKLAKSGKGHLGVSEVVWMQCHNPLSKDPRPLLPGQRFPGLGLGRKVAESMEQMAKDSPLTDALINFPFHWFLSAAYAKRGWRYVDPIVEAYVDWLSACLEPTVELHGYAFTAWAVSLGHLRRVTEEQGPTTGDWSRVSTRLERWHPSEQVYATSPAIRGWLYGDEWKALYDKWKAVFDEDGGANGEGVSVVEGIPGARRRSTLMIDLEGCPELWHYSKIWSNRDPETGNFR